MKTKLRILAACLLLGVTGGLLQSQASPAATAAAEPSSAQIPLSTGVSAEGPDLTGDGASPWKYLAAALAVGLACIGGGIAVGRIGAAAMGAMSEKPELASKAIPFAGLAEGICLWGFLVAILILFL